MRNFLLIVGIITGMYGMACLDSTNQPLAVGLAITGMLLMVPWLLEENQKQKGERIGRERKPRSTTRDFTRKYNK